MILAGECLITLMNRFGFVSSSRADDNHWRCLLRLDGLCYRLFDCVSSSRCDMVC